MTPTIIFIIKTHTQKNKLSPSTWIHRELDVTYRTMTVLLIFYYIPGAVVSLLTSSLEWRIACQCQKYFISMSLWACCTKVIRLTQPVSSHEINQNTTVYWEDRLDGCWKLDTLLISVTLKHDSWYFLMSDFFLDNYWTFFKINVQ